MFYLSNTDCQLTTPKIHEVRDVYLFIMEQEMEKDRLLAEIFKILKGLSVREAEGILNNMFSKLKDIKVI